MTEFKLPAELQGTTYESVLAKMLALVPDKYDKTEGGFVFDMIAPSALEADELISFWLALGLKMNFYMFASGDWLDLHAQNIGLKRNPATPAYVTIKINLSKAVTFPKGFIFSVPSEDGTPAIDFATVKKYTCASAGEYELRVRAVEVGLSGNVPAHTITIMKNPLKGVISITNEAEATGGTTAETDESLRQRIEDFYAGRGASFVGNAADYRRWARQIPSVGYVRVIPNYAGENSVKLVLSDSNGKPATSELCAQVEKYIFGTSHDDLERLAPIGLTKWSVVWFQKSEINVTLKGELIDGYSRALVIENIKARLQELFDSLSDEEFNFDVLRYVDVMAALSKAAGLADFYNVTVNGKAENVIFDNEHFPVVGTVNLT